MEDLPEFTVPHRQPETLRRWFSSEPHWWVRDFLVAGLVGLILVGVQIFRDDQRDANDQRLNNLSFVRDKASGPNTARNFQNIDLEGMNISGLDLLASKFQDADLKGIKASRSSLTLSSLDGAQASEANLNLANMEAVDFRSADASGVDFSYTHLEYSEFKETKLQGARFDHANLDDVDLSQIDMSGVTGLETASFNNVCYDEDTRWPEGFRPPPSRTGTERLDYCGRLNYPPVKQGQAKLP